MQVPSLSRLSGWSLFLCAAALTARAQTSPAATSTESVQLERFVVSATRSSQDLNYTPSSVSLVLPGDLAAAQVTDLRVALSREPGVVVVNTGALGGPSSIFLRGANPDQTLFVVDGVRMNDRSATYLNFLGAADLANIERIEVLRGPQSTLYGSSAMGGVILLESVHGVGQPTGSLTATGGSFNTIGGGAAVSGDVSKFGYSASVNRLFTQNDQPRNDLRQWSYATRLEYAASETLTVGGTFRGQNDDYEQTGSRLFPAPGFVTTDNYLGTVYGQMRVADNLVSKLTAGVHRRHYTFTDKYGVSDLRNTRKILDWQNTWQAAPQLEVVAGANLEWSRYIVDTVRSTDDVAAGYVSTTARPIENVTLNAGIRYDDFKSVGGHTTWRTGASWRVASSTKLRATYGTGFSAPGSDDRYGVAQWGQLPNPNIKPESSRGWDAGVDQDLLNRKATVSATYFQNRFRDLFEWEYVDFVTFQGRTTNRAHAKTSGAEFAFRQKLSKQLEASVSYTYLEAKNSDTGARLIRRPRHVFDGELRSEVVSGWTIGTGLHFVADRVERSAAGEDYTTARLFTSYAVQRNLILKLRIENALDERYEEVLGYSSLPRAIFGSVEWRF